MIAPKLSLSVQYASTADNLPSRSQFRRWVKLALLHNVQITLRIVDEIEGRALNKDFRGKDYTTNVLTFVYDDVQIPPGLPNPPAPLSGGEPGEESVLSGDIVICAPVVEREARTQHKDLPAHYTHLAIHAALHLQGYEHEKEADAAVMEALETALLAKLGYADPYQVVIL